MDNMKLIKVVNCHFTEFIKGPPLRILWHSEVEHTVKVYGKMWAVLTVTFTSIHLANQERTVNKMSTQVVNYHPVNILRKNGPLRWCFQFLEDYR